MSDSRNDKIRWEFADEADRLLRDQIRSVECPTSMLERWKNTLRKSQNGQEGDSTNAAGIDYVTISKAAKSSHVTQRAWSLVIAATLVCIAIGWSIVQWRQPSDQAFYSQSQIILSGQLNPTSIELSKLRWFESVGSQLSLSRVVDTETLTSTESDFRGTIVKISSASDSLYVMAYPLPRSLGFSRSFRPVPGASGGWTMAAMEADGVLVVIATKGSLKNWINVNAFT
jgi:hypothetical protein